jgi:multidrug efflux pump subunit AcrB
VVCIPQTLTSLESNTVMIQAKPEDRANLESINNIYVMNNSGQKWRSVSSSISKESMVLKLFSFQHVKIG